MTQVWRLALRDLRGSRAGLRLMALCLFLGVAALAGIGSLSSAILSGLSERGQLLLGGDVQFEAAQRTASPQERDAFAKLGGCPKSFGCVQWRPSRITAGQCWLS